MDNGQLSRLMQYQATKQKVSQPKEAADSFAVQGIKVVPLHMDDYTRMASQLDDVKSGKINVSYEDSRLGVGDRLVKQNWMGYTPKVASGKDGKSQIETSCFMRLDKDGNPSFYRGVDASYNKVLEKTGQSVLETGSAFMQNGKPIEFDSSLGFKRNELAFEPMTKEEYMSLTFATDDDISAQVERVSQMSSAGKIPDDGFVPMVEQPNIGSIQSSAIAAQSILNTKDVLAKTDFDQKGRDGRDLSDTWNVNVADCYGTSEQMFTPGMTRNLVNEGKRINSDFDKAGAAGTVSGFQQGVSYDAMSRQLQQIMGSNSKSDEEEDKAPSFAEVFVKAYAAAYVMQMMSQGRDAGIGAPNAGNESPDWGMVDMGNGEKRAVRLIHSKIDITHTEEFEAFQRTQAADHKLDMDFDYEPEMENTKSLEMTDAQPEGISADKFPAKPARDIPDALKSSVADFDANFTATRGVPAGMESIHADTEEPSMQMG